MAGPWDALLEGVISGVDSYQNRIANYKAEQLERWRTQLGDSRANATFTEQKRAQAVLEARQAKEDADKVARNAPATAAITRDVTESIPYTDEDTQKMLSGLSGPVGQDEITKFTKDITKTIVDKEATPGGIDWQKDIAIIESSKLDANIKQFELEQAKLEASERGDRKSETAIAAVADSYEDLADGSKAPKLILSGNKAVLNPDFDRLSREAQARADRLKQYLATAGTDTTPTESISSIFDEEGNFNSEALFAYGSQLINPDKPNRNDVIKTFKGANVNIKPEDFLDYLISGVSTEYSTTAKKLKVDPKQVILDWAKENQPVAYAAWMKKYGTPATTTSTPAPAPASNKTLSSIFSPANPLDTGGSSFTDPSTGKVYSPFGSFGGEPKGWADLKDWEQVKQRDGTFAWINKKTRNKANEAIAEALNIKNALK